MYLSNHVYYILTDTHILVLRLNQRLHGAYNPSPGF